MKKFGYKIAGLVAIGMIVLSGCSDNLGTPGPAPAPSVTTDLTVDKILNENDLENLSAEEIINKLDETSLTDRSKEFTASVRHDEIIFGDASTGKEVGTLEISGNKQYISFSPYVEQTHDCYYHSLTTCVGELGDEEMHLTIVNDGEIVIDENITTFDNGFYGVWLDKDESYTVTFEYGDYSGTGIYKTDEDSATCVSDLQLTKE